ncbi:MAG: hemerythrin domain-containing protein [Acidovorax sp.]|uniref:hemerythrin domain-containing protein n=1 Tax=Acidovorax sp. TaxID=1872122 RepID=UPI0039E46E7E
MADTPSNIFEALRESHELQRSLALQVLQTSGDTPERHALFKDLREELAAHTLAEDRHFYVPLMQHDAGMDLSRHAIAEHHEIDELVEDLEKTDPSSPGWLARARKLSEKVHHHLEEEERKFFQMAGKLLTAQQKTALARDYLADYEDAKAAAA